MAYYENFSVQQGNGHGKDTITIILYTSRLEAVANMLYRESIDSLIFNCVQCI